MGQSIALFALLIHEVRHQCPTSSMPPRACFCCLLPLLACLLLLLAPAVLVETNQTQNWPRAGVARVARARAS